MKPMLSFLTTLYSMRKVNMKTILLETNAINNCLDNSINGAELLAILNKKNFSPVINMHTKYELARTFLNHDTHARGKNLF